MFASFHHGCMKKISKQQENSGHFSPLCEHCEQRLTIVVAKKLRPCISVLHMAGAGAGWMTSVRWRNGSRRDADLGAVLIALVLILHNDLALITRKVSQLECS